jgi:hypothetical protein
MRLLLTFALLAFAVPAPGHSDPFGEIHPRVSANNDGTFTVTFRYFDHNREGRMRMLLGSDGRELVPRHWIKETQKYPDDFVLAAGPVTVLATGDKARFVLVESEPLTWAPAPAVIGILPFEALDFAQPEKSSVTESQIAFTGATLDARTEDGVEFSLWCSRRYGFQPGRKVTVGVAARIYDFPTASAPLWSGDKWWVAWVQLRVKGDVQSWITVLSSVNPDTGKVEHHDLPGISNWNAHLSMAASTAGTICVAWHSTQDGSYPGTAKIVTAVFNPAK